RADNRSRRTADHLCAPPTRLISGHHVLELPSTYLTLDSCHDLRRRELRFVADCVRRHVRERVAAAAQFVRCGEQKIFAARLCELAQPRVQVLRGPEAE